MVDANRLPQVLAGSRADRLKRPIDAAGVWLRISRSNGIPEFPVRRDELTEELTPVTALATTALTTAETKIDAAQVLTLLNSAFQNLFQEYPLVGGLEHREVDPTDNREYVYTVYPIQTAYSSTFEELALVSNDATETLLDVEYGVYKELPGRIVLVFRDMDEGFTNGIAKIKLIGIPTLEEVVQQPAPNFPTVTGDNAFLTTTTGLPASFSANSTLRVIIPVDQPRDGTFNYVLVPFTDGGDLPRVEILASTVSPEGYIDYPVSTYANQGKTPPFPLTLAVYGANGWSATSNQITINA